MVSAVSSPIPNEQAHRRARARDPGPGRAGSTGPGPVGRGGRCSRAGSRGRAHADQHRAAASGDPRSAAAGGRARRRDRGAGDPPPGLSALGVRETGRVSPLQPDHPAHRPYRLPVAHGEQRRLRARRGEADGHRDHPALHRAARDGVRDEPDHLAHGVARHDLDRPWRVHPVSLGVPGARADLQPPGDVDRRPAHHQRDAGGRPDGRRHRRFCRRAPRIHPDLPADPERDRSRADPERRVGRAHPRRGRAHGRGGDEPFPLGPDVARFGRRVRRAEGQSVPRLRDVRLRRRGGRTR